MHFFLQSVFLNYKKNPAIHSLQKERHELHLSSGCLNQSRCEFTQNTCIS